MHLVGEKSNPGHKADQTIVWPAFLLGSARARSQARTNEKAAGRGSAPGGFG